MSRPATYIKPESIRIGDTIRVEYTDRDTRRSTTGIVASREHAQEGTFWKTAGDVVLLYRDLSMNTGAFVYLLYPAEELAQPTLEGI